MAPRGFTLIELMVVVIILGVISVATSLSIEQVRRTPLEQDVRRLTRDFQLAQAYALRTGRPVIWQASETGYRFLTPRSPAGLSEPVSLLIQTPADLMVLTGYGVDPRAWQHPQGIALLQGQPTELQLLPETLQPAWRLSLSHGSESWTIQLGAEGLFQAFAAQTP